MSKKTFFSVLSGVLVLPTLALADCGGKFTVKCIMDSILNVTWEIATGVTIVLWVITGILFLSAQGAPEKVNTAKKALIAAAAGTVIVILAYSAITIVEKALGA